MLTVVSTSATNIAEVEWQLNGYDLRWSEAVIVGQRKAKKRTPHYLSQVFSAPGDEGVKWQLGIYPSGIDYSPHQRRARSERDSFTVVATLVGLPDGRPDLVAKCSILLRDAKRNVTLHEETHPDPEVFTLNHEGSGFWQMGSQQMILGLEALSIVFRVQYGAPFEVHKVQNPYDPTSLQVLGNDFGALYDSKQGCDFVITVRGQEFDVHKVVMLARSPQFSEMFEYSSDSSERADYDHFSPELFDVFLRYLYTGKIDFTGVDASGLFLVANFFLVVSLQLICEVKMLERLTVQGCTELLIFSRNYYARRLESAVVDYIRVHRREIFVTEGWIGLKRSHPELVLTVLEGLVM